MDWRTEIDGILEGTHPRIGRAVLYGLYALIIISTVSIGVETFPNLPPWLTTTLAVLEVVTVAVFTVEYLLRIAIARRKLRYIFSFWGLVDLLAILPFYLSFGMDLRAVRAVRLFRLFRLLKLVRYTHAAERMQAAFRIVREELIIFGTVALVVLYLCALGIYYCEHEAQPDKYATLFDAIWWAAVTMTTVGYGDIYPITIGGRLFTIAVLLIALGVIAVPTGLVSSALARLRTMEAEAARDGEAAAPASPNRQ